LLTFIGSLPGGALAGAASSWWLANRKAKSDTIQGVRDARTDLLSEVHCYWAADSRDTSLERAITRQQMKFDVKLRDFFEKYGKAVDRSTFTATLTRFNAFLTSAPFGTVEFRQSPHLSEAARQRIADVMRFVR
jgi:hypothetical protein